MDLIYEGITTTRPSLLMSSFFCQNGPDLRRDYDGTSPSGLEQSPQVRMDLIYEGITTRL